MKTLMLSLSVICMACCILANPITKTESDLFVTEINNTAESNEIPAAPSAPAQPETRSEDKQTEAPSSDEPAATVAIEGRDDLASTATAIKQRADDAELKTTEAPRSERLDDATKKPEEDEALTARSASEQPQESASVEPKSAGNELPIPTEASERDPKLEAESTLAPKEERKEDAATSEPEATGRSIDDSSSKPEEESASRAAKGDDNAATTELALETLAARHHNEFHTAAPSEESSEKPSRKRRDVSQEDIDEEIANTVEPVSHLAADTEIAKPAEVDASKEEEIERKGEEQLLTVRNDIIASEAPKDEDEDKEEKPTAAPKPEILTP